MPKVQQIELKLLLSMDLPSLNVLFDCLVTEQKPYLFSQLYFSLQNLSLAHVCIYFVETILSQHRYARKLIAEKGGQKFFSHYLLAFDV